MNNKNFFSLRYETTLVKEKLEACKISTISDLTAYVITLSASSLTETQEKGVKRRVYEIIHVLSGLGLVNQENKVIRWLGFPHQSEEEKELKKENERLLASIESAKITLAELHDQINLYSALCERNLDLEPIMPEEKLHLPFIAITTDQPYTEISVNEDQSECWIDLSMPFKIQDDVEVLKKIL